MSALRVIQLNQVDIVALRLGLPAQRASGAWLTIDPQNLPSPDATLGDELGRSATKPTKPGF